MQNRKINMLEAKILFQQGKKQKEIAERYGVSVRTVHNWLKQAQSGDIDRPDGRKSRKIKLEPYLEQIRSVVEEEPHLNCEILFENLRKQGYTGGISRLREVVAAIRKQITMRVALTFETLPGKQAQMDWKECGRFRFADGKYRKVYAFVMQLGYSRRAFVCLVTRMNSATLLACHLAAFRYFGGVPAEILYDNMKTAWLFQNGKWVCNPRLRAFATDCGFVAKRCKTYCPWTKGKVERFNGFIGKNLLPRLERDGLNLDEINDRVLTWLDTVADVRVMRTWGESRRERFEREKPLLRPLPDSVDCTEAELLQVHRDSTIQYRMVRYSVPARLIGMQVELRVDPLEESARLVSQGKTVRSFRLEPEGSQRRLVMLAQDNQERQMLWEEQEARRKERQARKERIKRLNEELSTCSPACYDSLMEEVAA